MLFYVFFSMKKTTGVDEVFIFAFEGMFFDFNFWDS